MAGSTAIKNGNEFSTIFHNIQYPTYKITGIECNGFSWLQIHTEAFRSVLEHRTDYVALVDAMLADMQAHEFPQLEVEKPLGPDASCEEVWEALRSSATPSLPRVSVFRFMRFAPPQEKPYVDHWTVGRFMDTAGLHFLDCSLEPGALHCLPHARLTDRNRPLSREYVVVAPESIRILSSSRPKTFALPV